MKKVVTGAILFLCLSFSAFSQVVTQPPPMGAKPRDTVAYFIEFKYDTVKVDYLYFMGTDGNVKWCSPGYQIRQYRVATTDGKKFTPLNEPPVIISALDDKKRKVKPLK